MDGQEESPVQIGLKGPQGFGLTFKGTALQLMLGLVILIPVLMTAAIGYLIWGHESSSKVRDELALKSVSAFTIAVRQMAEAQRETSCILSLPQGARPNPKMYGPQDDFCKRMSKLE